MGSPEEIENIQTLFRYQHSFLTFKIISTTCELGVFDLLRESEELLSSATVAERLSTSLTGMQRLLEACLGLKVLKVEWKDNIGLYGNTEFADLYLAKSSPKSQYYSMKIYSEVTYPSVQYLPEAVRDGNSQILSIYGISSKDVYEALYRANFNSRTEEGVESVFRYTSEAWSLHGKEVVSAFDLSSFQLICDLGGSSGGLAKEIISKYPNCTVKLFDLPEVVKRSEKYFVSSDESQITFHEGDFFKDPIPEADLYMLSRVICGWSDGNCIELLSKVFTACKPGGGVLVVEPTVEEDKSGSFPAYMYSTLLMLHTGGRARTPSEHHALLNTAGFKDIQFKKGNIFDVILARK